MKSTAKSNARGVMDTSSPAVYPHVQNKQKKQFEIRMRNRQIDRENEVLYDKLKKIMESHAKDNKSFGNGVSISKTGVPTIDCWNTSENDYSSLNLSRRKQEFDKINRENEVILDALEKTESYYPRKELLEEYERKQFLFSLCAKRPAVGLPRSPRRNSPRSARSPRKLPPLQSTQETCNGEDSLKPEPPKKAPNSARPSTGGRRIVEHNEDEIDPIESEVNPTISSTTVNNNNIQQEESTQQSVIVEDVNEDPSTVEQPTEEEEEQQQQPSTELEPPTEPKAEEEEEGEESKPVEEESKPEEETKVEETEPTAEEESKPTEEPETTEEPATEEAEESKPVEEANDDNKDDFNDDFADE